MLHRCSRTGAPGNRSSAARLVRECATAVVEPMEHRMLLSTARVAAISDYGMANTPESNVAAMVRRWDDSATLAGVITSGDNYQGDYTTSDPYPARVGADNYYGRFIKRAADPPDKVNRFFPSPGNHDWVADNTLSFYRNYFNHLPMPTDPEWQSTWNCYDFVKGPIHFFSIDSDAHEPAGYTESSLQGQWLQRNLKASTSPWNIVYFHHPAYCSAPYDGAGRHGSNPEMQWDFKEWGADVVINGHDHFYERLETDGVLYLINGLGGANPATF